MKAKLEELENVKLNTEAERQRLEVIKKAAEEKASVAKEKQDKILQGTF